MTERGTSRLANAAILAQMAQLPDATGSSGVSGEGVPSGASTLVEARADTAQGWIWANDKINWNATEAKAIRAPQNRLSPGGGRNAFAGMVGDGGDKRCSFLRLGLSSWNGDSPIRRSWEIPVQEEADLFA